MSKYMMVAYEYSIGDNRNVDCGELSLALAKSYSYEYISKCTIWLSTSPSFLSAHPQGLRVKSD